MVLKFGHFIFLFIYLDYSHTLKEKEFTDFIIKAQNDREKYVTKKETTDGKICSSNCSNNQAIMPNFK